jgi:prophage antirepressor-like protein
MKNIFETLDKNYILFEDIVINVIIDNTDKLWFNANMITKAIGYKDSKDAIKTHITKNEKIQFKFINHSNTTIKQQPQTLYISEAGLYKLILRSKLQKAQIFANWVTNDVLPSIRKYGYYKMKKSYENKKIELLERINYLEKQQKLMRNDLKKHKFPNGALVYVVDYSYEDNKVDGIFKIGKTDNMNKRKQIYDTHMLHKRKVIYKEITDNPLQFENCLRSMLYDYRYKDRKDFYICKLSIIKKAFNNCIKSIKNMNQKGGGINEIDILNNKINKLNKNILNMEYNITKNEKN